MSRGRHPVVSMRSLVPLALGLALGGCGEEAPAVDVSTYVGPSYARNDPEQRSEHASKVASAMLDELMSRTRPSADPTGAEPVEVAPIDVPTDAEALDELVAAVRTVPLDEIGGPARRIAAAPAELWPQIRDALVAERVAPKGDYRSLLDAIGGDVPNRYGHFARAWKKAHGYSVKLSDDWFEDLLMLPTGRVARGLRPVHRDCVLQTALLRAAAGIGRDDPTRTGEVVATLLDVAYLHGGTFRDEVGRAITAVGDEAIPYLLVESLPPAGRRRDDDSDEARRAEYAEVQLDKMDRLHPARATEAVREDPRLLALVLDAYGTVRPGEAATVLLDFADAPAPAVRASARAAFAAYVTGPPPLASHRKVRLLGGGTANKRAHLTYRQRASLAIRQRMEQDVPEELEPACEIHREDGSIDGECEAQPERLMNAYYAWLDHRRETEDRQALEAALAEPDPRVRVARLDELLVGNPELTAGPQLVPVYCEAADAARADGDEARAGQLLRKAARLAERNDADAGRELRVQALLAEAAVPELTPEGRRMLLGTARDLDPDDERVETALAGVARPGGGGSGPSRRFGPLAGMVAGLWALGVIGSWWRRRRSPRAAMTTG